MFQKRKSRLIVNILLLYTFFSTSFIWAQDSSSLFSDEESSLFSDESGSGTDETFEFSAPDDPLFSDENSAVINNQTQDSRMSPVQNAVLEGIQITKETSQVPDEVIITCYFIFRDKPTSYFYEAKLKEKKIIFEFNDVELGTSPIPSVKEPPIQGFRLVSEKVDANKEVVGLNPEWHDILKVHFFMDAIPEITVKDEYSIISFSFRWSTNPAKIAQFSQTPSKKGKVILFSLLGSGAALGGLGAFLFLKNDDGNQADDGPIDISDIPKHPDPKKP